MSRRLVGYVVKRPDGTRHAEGHFSLLDAADISHGSVPPTHITPVFAVRKPKPALAEGRYAVLRKMWLGNQFCDLHYGDDTRALCHVGTRAAVDEAQRKSGRTNEDASVVRVLPDGAHEAAIAAAREEGRREALAMLRENLVAERDDAATDAKERNEAECHEAGYLTGIVWAIGLLDEAAKGQDK